jgi:nucleolar protein 56
MKAVIVQFPFGVVAFDEANNIVGSKVYPKKPQAAAKAIAKNSPDKLTEEASALITQLQTNGYDTFLFESQIMANQANSKFGVECNVAEEAQIQELHGNTPDVAVKTGFVKDVKDFTVWNRNVSVEVAKLQVKGATEKRDLVVGQAIQTLDDLDRTLNLFMGRLREWYGVHFPELDRLVEKHETFARLVLDLGTRANFTLEALEKEDLPKNKTEIIAHMAESSMGADLNEADLIQVQAVSRNVLDMYKVRGDMETYLDKTMEEVAPNTKAIVGALLGARMIAIAGGLQNLARRPASTMQVLGAEKALFRSIKTGAAPPKHGLIFQHTLVHDAKKWQRGKIARAIAGKLAIAVRTDAFRGEYAGNKLKADLDRRIEEIRKKYPEPPPVKEGKPREFSERRDFSERREGGGFRDRRGGGGFGGRDRRGSGGSYGGNRDRPRGSGGFRDRGSGGGFRDRGSGGSRGDSYGERRSSGGYGGERRDSASSGSDRPSGGSYFEKRRESGNFGERRESSNYSSNRPPRSSNENRPRDRSQYSDEKRGSGGFGAQRRDSGKRPNSGGSNSGGDRRDRSGERKWRQNKRADKS